MVVHFQHKNIKPILISVLFFFSCQHDHPEIKQLIKQQDQQIRENQNLQLRLKGLESKLADQEKLVHDLQILGHDQSKSLQLVCQPGDSVKGSINQWSPWSPCPIGWQVTGLSRIDLLGRHETPHLHVNDFECSEKGCRAWCIGSACTVISRCCRIAEGLINDGQVP